MIKNPRVCGREDCLYNEEGLLHKSLLIWQEVKDILSHVAY